jgi:AcrR family transcriptional regulator
VKSLKNASEQGRHNDPLTRTTKQEWIALAIDALVNEGIERVKIQVIAKKLDVSRSSFYWFFKSHQDLLDQILQYWLEVNTGPIIERAMRPAPTIIRAILNVSECWMDSRLFNPKLDIAVRLWARRSGSVREVVQQADDMRIDAITQMFRRYGYEQEDAFIRARVLYFTQIGFYTLEVQESLETRFSHCAAYLQSFSGCKPTQDDIKYFQDFLHRNGLLNSEQGSSDTPWRQRREIAGVKS